MTESINVIADHDDLYGEAPLWGSRNQILYWTDITGRRFHRYFWREKRHETLRDRFEVAGVAILEDGGFAVVNSDGIWLWDGKDDPRCIAQSADGGRCVLTTARRSGRPAVHRLLFLRSQQRAI
jgi:sugar lactone lactonase YvrE